MMLSPISRTLRSGEVDAVAPPAAWRMMLKRSARMKRVV
jgi:hypothetical protein